MAASLSTTSLRFSLLVFASSSFYTVRDRSLCIYRDGEFSKAEREEYCRMKRSPYRNYLEGNYNKEDNIAFIRVIDTPERISEIDYLIRSVLPPGMFRIELREEAQFPQYRGIYFYDPKATVKEMQSRVQSYLESADTASDDQSAAGNVLTPVVMLPKLRKYVPEHDALMLLGRLKNEYEPVSLRGIFRKKAKK